jgi:hypothetical protein
MAEANQPTTQDKLKAKFRKEGDDIYNLGSSLAKSPQKKADDFREWCNRFEEGYTDKTAEADDTPYNRPRGNRPRITIL